ncbi:MAG: hypothetical protein MI974_31365 [Chitinophagales bacterium]|nr:hypothetical protein [Chitinophagales bacterium]
MTVEARILQLEQKVDILISLLQYERKAWITPEETAQELGYNVTPNRDFTRKLAILRRRGDLTKYIPGRPYKYDKAEVRQLADDVREGKKQLP